MSDHETFFDRANRLAVEVRKLEADNHDLADRLLAAEKARDDYWDRLVATARGLVAAEKERDEKHAAMIGWHESSEWLRKQLAQRRDFTLTAERLDRLTDILTAWLDLPRSTDAEMKAELRDTLERWSREASSPEPLVKRFGHYVHALGENGAWHHDPKTCTTCLNRDGATGEPPAPDLLAELEATAMNFLGCLPNRNMEALEALRELWKADFIACLEAKENKS